MIYRMMILESTLTDNEMEGRVSYIIFNSEVKDGPRK